MVLVWQLRLLLWQEQVWQLSMRYSLVEAVKHSRRCRISTPSYLIKQVPFLSLPLTDLLNEFFFAIGTITQGGNPRVIEAHLPDKGPGSESWSAEDILMVASSLEQGLAHPLANAIRDYCKVNGASPATLEDITEVPGKGLKGTSVVLHALLIIGNESWLHEHAFTLDSDHVSTANAWRSKSCIVILLGLRSIEDCSLQSVSTFAIADPLRPEAKAVIDWMQSNTLEVWMITGDNHVTAQTVASAVGIPATRVLSGVLPREKVRFLLGINFARTH